MGFRAVIFISLAVFLLPFTVSAEEPSLIEAMCKQVLEPRAETSVLGVIKDHFVGKFSGVPEKVVDSAKGTADSAAESLAKNLESKELDSKVLGASIINPAFNKTLDGAAFLARHWIATLLGLGIVVVIFFFL